MEQLLRDMPKVDLCPHQRDQVHFQPLLTSSGELLFLVLRRQNKALDGGIPGSRRPLLAYSDTAPMLESGATVPSKPAAERADCAQGVALRGFEPGLTKALQGWLPVDPILLMEKLRLQGFCSSCGRK